MSTRFTEAELEAGRLVFARPWRFTMSCVSADALPDPDRTEIAFAGRSNVGKSSLINAVCGREGLARISNTPGRTQALNIFEDEAGGLRLVDMPGHGFARAPKQAIRNWTALIGAYLGGRPTLRRVYALIDARHGIKPTDEAIFALLDSAAVSYQGVLTKADKVPVAELESGLEKAASGLARHPAAHPDILATSSVTGLGIDELRAEIARLG